MRHRINGEGLSSRIFCAPQKAVFIHIKIANWTAKRGE